MTDLDGALRTMLQTRAQDITSLPPTIGHFDTERAHSRPRSAQWLVAASVAAVLAVVGIVIAVGRHSGDRGVPPGTPTPTPSISTSTVAPAPTTHIDSRVSLSWFGMAALPSYTSLARESVPGHEWLGLRLKGDTGYSPGCDGCEPASVYVYVFAKGALDTSKFGIRSGQQVTVDGTPALWGEADWYDTPAYRVPTIAWQFRPGEWVLVQGVTTLGGSKLSLLTVADAVRPAVSVPIGLPCSFGYLPALPIVDISDDRSEGYTFGLTMGDVQGRSFTITLWDGAGWSSFYNPAGMTAQTVDGLPGYFGAQQGVGVLYHGGGMSFGFGENLDPGGNTFTPADEAQTQQVIAGVHWANGDGRPPLVAAQKTIP